MAPLGTRIKIGYRFWAPKSGRFTKQQQGLTVETATEGGWNVSQADREALSNSSRRKLLSVFGRRLAQDLLKDAVEVGE